ncbi:MAG: prepilin peptidase [Planctomyces sp.]|nr:prepilin peptidase [Planctomyces sp.]
MFAPLVGNWILAAAMALFTAVAAGWDLREKRIPNRLTLPVFFAGWIYQLAFHGWSGLADGAAGFAVGFGVLFVLWFIGGGGGGDVKLMGALSVWMGFRLTLLVLVASTVAVVLITLSTVAWQVCRQGARRTKARYVAGKTGPKSAETIAQRQSRRILPYAVPVAAATWLVLAWKIPALNRAVRAAEQPESPPAAAAAPEGGRS